MKALIFDSGPLISLTMNNLLWLLEPMKKSFGGEFYVTESVKKELVDKPLSTKRFKFEALQIQRYISNGIIKVIKNEETKEETVNLLDLANKCIMAKGNFVDIVHYGEIACLAAALKFNASAVVIDERTTRKLIESPNKLVKLMGNRLHTDVTVNRANLKKVRDKIKGIKVIRSIEIVTVAYEKGLFHQYVVEEKDVIPNIKKTLLESLLWGLKLDGCSISDKDIHTLMKIEGF
ncbi:MAG: hypothetical protein GY861_19640 [bacterium]|nr:hypothetical protein [bacterium]